MISQNKTLIVGCSFVSRLNYRFETDLPVNGQKYQVLDNSGASNTALAACVLKAVSEQKYDQVIVLWSGVNRLDQQLSSSLGITNQSMLSQTGNIFWHHSGGKVGSGLSAASPKVLKNILHEQYVHTEVNPTYLSELTLLSIASAQGVLVKQGIPYKMGFIYNAYKPDVKDPNEHSLGKLDRSSSFTNLIDWYSFTQHQPPYEWAKKHNKLESDQFHPTRNAMIEWFKLAFDIDLTV